MDGRERVYESIFVERLWISFKYEEFYPHRYLTVPKARKSINQYFMFYNTKRMHEGAV